MTPLKAPIATETAPTAEQSASVPVADGSASSPTDKVAAPAAPAHAPAAMPKDDDWDLPADLDGNNAFVPLEAGE